jgi:thymidine kinase
VDNTQNDLKLGSIVLYTGCSKSGKTRELIKHINTAKASGLEPTLFVPNVKTKHSWGFIKSRAYEIKFEAQLINPDSPGDILDKSLNSDVVIIDEAQEFAKELKDIVYSLYLKGQNVNIAAIEFNTLGNPIVTTSELKKLTEIIVIEKFAVCALCDSPATRSYRKKFYVDARLFKKLEPLCLTCWNNIENK